MTDAHAHAHAAGARALAARLFPRLDAVAEPIADLRRPWERRRLLRELLAQELASELGLEAPRWAELREREVVAALRAMLEGRHPGRGGA